MPLPVYRLRRMLALTAALFVVLVLGVYFYARSRIHDVRSEVGSKLGIEIKQTANGFQFSKSDGKRTLFTVQASEVKEFKLNGRAELHNVKIVLYGRDSSRFDQIYGDDFAYDPQTGDITAKGEVQIDLVANPAGMTSPDQAVPKQQKNPIHLLTHDLIFNRESGNASTDAKVEFRTAQASGSAAGVRYAGKSNTLTLASQVHIVMSGAKRAVIDAQHGVITSDPREITLDAPRLESGSSGTMTSDRAVFFLNPENQVERVLCTGNVTSETRMTPKGQPVGAELAQAEESLIHGHAEQAEFLLTGKRDDLHTAILTGSVHFERTGSEPMQGDAGRAVIDFANGNQVQTVHALEGAHLAQKAAAKKPGSAAQPQNFDLTAPAIDFTVAQGNVLEKAVTSGAAQITISPQGSVPTSASAAAASPQRTILQQTIVTADKFEAEFATTDGRNHLTTMHGAPNARVVSTAPGQPERVSTSDSIDATFLPQGGIDAVMQQGHVVYSDSQPPDKRTQSWASRARYTPGDQLLVLTGSPRVVNAGMETTARTIRINRATGDALANGDVKTTYSDLKEQPNGALLASSSPIHVTAKTMTAHNTPGVALYTGNARLWQDANVVEAPSIQFDRDRRFVTAQGAPDQPVRTILVQAAKPVAETKFVPTPGRRANPALNAFVITSARLTYGDSERKVHYEGGVEAKGSGFTATSATADAYLLPRSQTAKNQLDAGPAQLDQIVAQGDVVIVEPGRRAQGQNLVYTAADEKFVLTGGLPSIFDAEQGKITGVSLTFFRGDDRVLVEGEASTPVVRTTRVAR